MPKIANVTKPSVDPTAPFDAHHFFEVLRAAEQNPRLHRLEPGPIYYYRDVYDYDHKLAMQAYALR